MLLYSILYLAAKQMWSHNNGRETVKSSRREMTQTLSANAWLCISDFDILKLIIFFKISCMFLVEMSRPDVGKDFIFVIVTSCRPHSVR